MASKMTKFGYSGKKTGAPNLSKVSKHQVGAMGVPETGAPKPRKKGR